MTFHINYNILDLVSNTRASLLSRTLVKYCVVIIGTVIGNFISRL